MHSMLYYVELLYYAAGVKGKPVNVHVVVRFSVSVVSKVPVAETQVNNK